MLKPQVNKVVGRGRESIQPKQGMLIEIKNSYFNVSSEWHSSPALLECEERYMAVMFGWSDLYIKMLHFVLFLKYFLFLISWISVIMKEKDEPSGFLRRKTSSRENNH